jgi:hypothetical protein
MYSLNSQLKLLPFSIKLDGEREKRITLMKVILHAGEKITQHSKGIVALDFRMD